MLKKNASSAPSFQHPLHRISVSVSSDLVNKLIHFFIIKKKQDLLMHGFEKGCIPEAYIKEHFKVSILTHVEKIFFYFYAQGRFIENLSSRGAYIPRIFSYEKEIDLSRSLLSFFYEQRSSLCDYEKNVFDEKKKIKFPERKKYKDLDRQAYITLLQEEKYKDQLAGEILCIQEGDWIGIKVHLVDDAGLIIDDCLSLKLWIYMTSEGIDREIRTTFLGKEKGSRFLSSAFFFQELLSTDFLQHQFLIEITDHVSHLYLDFEKLSIVYRCNRDQVIEKMIEVFSLRNDISLKKEKSQLVLKHFLEKMKVSLDSDIITEHECMIKNRIVKNADYLLYQSDIHFLTNIKKLACRQAMEKVLIDYLIYKYNIKTDNTPIHVYLNILQRHRLKDFLFFDSAHVYDNTMKFVPIFDYMITQMALREKAIEYCIARLG
jgi:hypothetical protein